MKRIVVIFLLIAGSPASFADAHSGTREVLLDNAAVEVVRLTYPAGGESGSSSLVPGLKPMRDPGR